MKKLLACIMALTMICILAGCSQPAENAKNDPAPAAAYGSGALKLVAADLPAGPEGYWMPVSLSPDGKTVIWRSTVETGVELCAAREGKILTLRFNAERGAGDPYGKAERLGDRTFSRLPAMENFSWTPDGRFFAISDFYLAINHIAEPMFADVIMADPETGDLFLPVSYPDKFMERGPDFGYIIISRIDRSGKYVCYFMYSGEDGAYRFCRCPVEGGEPEILWEDSRDSFDLGGSISLLESADGSWLLLAVNGMPDKRPDSRFSLVRFSDTGDGWKAELFPTGVIYGRFRPDQTVLSAESGYGLICVGDTTAMQAAVGRTDADVDPEVILRTKTNMAMKEYISLMRIRPGDSGSAETPVITDMWYMQRKGSDPAEVELLPADAYQQVWTNAAVSNDIIAPDGFDVDAWEANRPMRITCAAMSPDGRYALVNALDRMDSGDTGRLYLIDLYTMEARFVETPEGIGGRLLASSSLNRLYYPMITWNADGTLLILNEKTSRTEAYRLVSD